MPSHIVVIEYIDGRTKDVISEKMDVWEMNIRTWCVIKGYGDDNGRTEDVISIQMDVWEMNIRTWCVIKGYGDGNGRTKNDICIWEGGLWELGVL